MILIETLFYNKQFFLNKKMPFTPKEDLRILFFPFNFCLLYPQTFYHILSVFYFVCKLYATFRIEDVSNSKLYSK